MSGISRITAPLLDVLAYLLSMLAEGREEVHGWPIIQATKRSAPTVYGVLDRLEDAEWITGRWEDSPIEGRPRRRLYRLTPNGTVQARQLLAERRPAPAEGARRPGWAMFGWLGGGCTDGLTGSSR